MGKMSEGLRPVGHKVEPSEYPIGKKEHMGQEKSDALVRNQRYYLQVRLH